MLWNTGSPQTSLRSTLAKNNWDLDELSWHVHSVGPSLLCWRSPATGVEAKNMHEESRDRGIGGGVFSPVKGICRTGGCFRLVPSKFWKMRGLNSNLRVTSHFFAYVYSLLGQPAKQKFEVKICCFLFKSLFWKQHLVLDYDLLLLWLNLR